MPLRLQRYAKRLDTVLIGDPPFIAATEAMRPDRIGASFFAYFFSGATEKK